MDSFKLASPLAQDPEVTSTSFHDQFAASLGKMTGGMMAEGSQEIINGSSVLVLFQAFANEAGVTSIVLGAKPSIDGESTFLAMSDGSVLRLSHEISGGNLVTSGHAAESDETIKDCSGIDGLGDVGRQICAAALVQAQRVEENDAVAGHVLVDAHAAICDTLRVTGRLIVNVGETNTIRCAVEFSINLPKDVPLSDALKYIKLKEMTIDEAKAELDRSKEALGITNPFPVKMGEA